MNPRIFLSLAASLCMSPAWADIYKCVDEAGHVTYTNSKPSGRGCGVLARDQAVSSVPSASRPAAAPQNGASTSSAGFPRVDTGTQKARDSDRRRILDEELANEQKALDAARRELASQESVRTDERNYQKALERLQPYKDKLQIHERNIEALRKEIANLR